MTETQALFPETYETSRERFRNNLSAVQSMWGDAKLFQHKLAGDDDLIAQGVESFGQPPPNA